MKSFFSFTKSSYFNKHRKNRVALRLYPRICTLNIVITVRIYSFLSYYQPLFLNQIPTCHIAQSTFPRGITASPATLCSSLYFCSVISPHQSLLKAEHSRSNDRFITNPAALKNGRAWPDNEWKDFHEGNIQPCVMKASIVEAVLKSAVLHD